MKLVANIFLTSLLFFSQVALADSAKTKKSLAALKEQYSSKPKVDLEKRELAGDKQAPTLYFGRRKVNNDFEKVDLVKKTQGGTATIFVRDGAEFIRITTNVLTAEGKRAVGTTLAKNKAYELNMKGETFCGVVDILGRSYDTCYEPIKEDNGNVIGIYYVGYPQE